MSATMLADFGADVIKIEHPTKGDPVRNHGPSKNGVPLWWAMLGRNKRTIALNLGAADGAEVFKRLVREADPTRARSCSRCSSIKTTKFRPKGEQQWHWDSS